MSIDRTLPLAGIKVLDFSQVQFGPMASQTLADFGADVIKVERPRTGDISRNIDQFADDIDTSAIFAALNRNKRSVALDVKHPGAQEVIHRLLAETDVLVENFRPGVPERLGLGYEDLRERYPRLIYASGSGYGASGPLQELGGQDIIAQSLSGAIFHNRDESGRPQIYPIPFVDFGAGMALVQGMLLALIERATSGRGQRVDVSLLDTGLFVQMQEYVQWMLRGHEIHWERDHLVGTFRAADDTWVTVVGLFRPHPLRTICEALGVEDLSQRPEFATEDAQRENRAALWRRLDDAFARLSSDEVLRRLSERDILCGPVLDYDAAVSHPQTVHNGSMRPVQHPRLGELRLVDTPVRLSAATDRPWEAPPLLGQHTRKVLAEAGLDQAEVDRVVAAGIAFDPSQETDA